MQQISQSSQNLLPFALRFHEEVFVDDEKTLGEPAQEWTWTPSGELKPSELSIYASGGNSTTRRTGSSQYDHGEFY